MKRFVIPIMLIFFGTGISCQLIAQKNKEKEKTVTLKIEKETDGEKVIIDTTFTIKKGDDIHKVLEKYGVNTDFHSKHAKSFKFDINTNDSLDNQCVEKMIWVTIDHDDDMHKHKMKGKRTKMFLISGDDEEEMTTFDEGDILHIEDFNEDVLSEEFDGDSIKIKKKIIITDENGGKHKKLEETYEFDKDSLNKRKHLFIVSEDDTENYEIHIKERKDSADSIDVKVEKLKKHKDGKHGKYVYITTDDNYTWKTDDDIHIIGKDGKFSKVKIEILDVDEADLKKLKINKKYDKLEINDFFIFLKEHEDRMDIKFTVVEKGDLSVKIFDTFGKEVFSDVKKQFEGKYKNETKALKGTYIVQISQGKKHYLKKMILEWNK